MAEKKFCGAPFGTQTARFDVTGVHPNKKVPGTFTQIPYDKPSTMELDGHARFSKKLQKMDARLQNIKDSLASVKSSVEDISCIGNGRFSHIASAESSKRGSLHSSLDKGQFVISDCTSEILGQQNIIAGSLRSSVDIGSVGDTCIVNDTPTTSHDENKKDMCEDSDQKILANCDNSFDERLTKETSESTGEQLSKENVARVTNFEEMFFEDNTPNILHPIWKFWDQTDPNGINLTDHVLDGNPDFASEKDIDAFIQHLHSSHSRRLSQDATNESFQGERSTNINQESPKNEKTAQASATKDEKNVSFNSCRDGNIIPSGATSKRLIKIASKQNNNISNNQSGLSDGSHSEKSGSKTQHSERDTEHPAIDIELVHEDATVVTTTDEANHTGIVQPDCTGLLVTEVRTSLSRSREKASKMDTATKNSSAPAVTLRPDIRAVIRLHTSTAPYLSKSGAVYGKPNPMPNAASSNGQTKSGKQATPQRKNSVKADSSCRKSSMQPPKPFHSLRPHGSNAGSEDRASSSSAKSSLRKRLQGAYAEDCETLLRRKLGPGAYNTIVGGFSEKSVEGRATGPGWSRQLEVERLAALPHLLYKEQWEENRMLKRKLGPGSYEIKDFIQRANEKPRTGRGICDNLAPRFDKGHQSATPGPGTYGIGGVPQRALEEKDTMATSTKGMLDKGDRKRTLPSVGSHLGPGTYRHKTCTEEMLNKVTSLKGPYKLYSGDRNKPITEGYLAAPQLADLGPGQYEIGSFVDTLNSKERRIHGKFGKMKQYPQVPTDRLFLFSNAHCNRRGVPGPGAYSVQELTAPASVNSPGFLSSAKRDDKMSQKFFTRNFNPVGAGRYDVQKFDEAQDINGHTSVFRSKTGKPNLQMAKFLQERIRSRDVGVENRVVLSQPDRITRSITVM